MGDEKRKISSSLAVEIPQAPALLLPPGSDVGVPGTGLEAERPRHSEPPRPSEGRLECPSAYASSWLSCWLHPLSSAVVLLKARAGAMCKSKPQACTLKWSPPLHLGGDFFACGLLFLLLSLLVPVLQALWKRSVLVQAASAFHEFFIRRLFCKWSSPPRLSSL